MTEHPLMVTATDVAAVSAVISPWWLTEVSAGAAWLLPILGCIWLGVQIFTKLLPLFRKHY